MVIVYVMGVLRDTLSAKRLWKVYALGHKWPE